MSEEAIKPLSLKETIAIAENLGSYQKIGEAFQGQLFEILDLKARIKELEEKLSLYEWKDIKDAKKSRARILLGWWAINYKGETVWMQEHGFWNFKYDAPMYELHECCEDHENPSACDKDKNGECFCKEGWYRYTDTSEEFIEPIPATHYFVVPTPPTQEGDKE